MYKVVDTYTIHTQRHQNQRKNEVKIKAQNKNFRCEKKENKQQIRCLRNISHTIAVALGLFPLFFSLDDTQITPFTTYNTFGSCFVRTGNAHLLADTVTPTTLTPIKFGNTLEGLRNYTILLNRTDITELGNK